MLECKSRDSLLLGKWGHSVTIKGDKLVFMVSLEAEEGQG